MDYLTPKELKEMMLLSYDRIETQKEDINKINVFPVPDQDTGNNMAKTLAGIKKAIDQREFKTLSEISDAILDAALTSAQGNAGVIYTGFLAGFLPELEQNPANCEKLTIALEKGAARARDSIQDPVPGTILDVIDATADTFAKETKKGTGIISTFRKAVQNANEALLATREKMEIFRKANVVDAGGLGFLIILESFLDALEKSSPAEVVISEKEPLSQKTRRFVQILSNRYEIVCLIENPNLQPQAVKEKLKSMGDSIDLVQVGSKMKIHIHTDYPREVNKVLRSLGQIRNLRMEDMAREVVGEKSIKKVSIGLVTDDGNLLLPKIMERYKIESVPQREIPSSNNQIIPQIAKPSQKDFLTAFKKQLESFEKVLCITGSSHISKRYQLAQKARGELGALSKIFIVDSKNVAPGQSLFILKAIESIQEQKEIAEIINELTMLIPETHSYIVAQNIKWIEKRPGMPQSFIGWMKKMKNLNLSPVMEIKTGTFAKSGAFWGEEPSKILVKRVLKSAKKELKESKKIRAVINHVDSIEQAHKLKGALKEKMSAEVSFINVAPATMAATFGPGMLSVAWTPLK